MNSDKSSLPAEPHSSADRRQIVEPSEQQAPQVAAELARLRAENAQLRARLVQSSGINSDKGVPNGQAARRQKLLDLESLPVAVFASTADMDIFTFVSNAAEELLGYTRQQLQKSAAFWFERVVHPEDRAALQSGLEAATEKGTRVDVAYRARRRDGKTRWLRQLADTVPDPSGGPGWLRGVFIDIQAYKETEQALQQAEEYRRLALEGARLGTWFNDLIKGETIWDARTREIFGVAPDVAASVETGFEIIHPEDRAGAQLAFEKAADPRTDGHYEIEKRLLLPDGQVRWIATTGRVHFEGSGDDRVAARMFGVLRDVTPAKLAQQELQASEEKLRSAIRAANVGTWRVDLLTGEDARDATANGILGLAPEDGVYPLADHLSRVHPDDRAQVVEAWQEALEAAGDYRCEHRILRPDGAVRWVRDRGRVIHDDNGQARYVAGAVVDVTESRQREQALEDAQKNLYMAQHLAAMGSLVYDFETQSAEYSPALYELLELDPNSFTPTLENTLEILAPADRERLHQQLAKARQVGRLGPTEYQIRRGDGAERIVVVESSVEHRENGEPARLVGVVQDITARQAMEEELRQRELELKTLNETLEEKVATRTEQVRALAQALTLAEQRERRRLSQLLHDDLQQILVALEVRCHLLHMELQGDASMVDNFNDVRSMLQQAIGLTRTLSIELDPPVLREEALDAALAWLTRHMREWYGLNVELQRRAVIHVSDPEKRILVVQLVRELLFNVVKHARVKEASVIVGRRGKRLLLQVKDPGVGFDVEQVKAQMEAGGLGLFSIRERLRLMDGDLEIRSQPGAGTVVELEVPLDNGTSLKERLRQQSA